MKKLIIISVSLLISFAVFSSRLIAQQISSSEELDKLNLEMLDKRLKINFLSSLVPKTIEIPDVLSLKRHKTMLEEHYPELTSLLDVDVSSNIFDIKSFKGVAYSHVGFPKFIRHTNQDDAFSVQKEVGRISSLYRKVVEEEPYLSSIEIQDNKDLANLFIMPVTSTSTLGMAMPNISPMRMPMERGMYKNITKQLLSIFPNSVSFKLNDGGLEGIYVTDSKGVIQLSFCPIDINSNDKTIKQSVFYCLVQSQGLPSFYSSMKTAGEQDSYWGHALLEMKKCANLEGEANVFRFLNNHPPHQCLSKEIIKNVGNAMPSHEAVHR